jgi:hypothetical protein
MGAKIVARRQQPGGTAPAAAIRRRPASIDFLPNNAQSAAASENRAQRNSWPISPVSFIVVAQLSKKYLTYHYYLDS